MRVEQIPNLLGRGFGQGRRFCLQLAQLFQRDCDRLGESGPFGIDFALGDMALANPKITALADMSRTDPDPCTHPKTPQVVLCGAAPPWTAGSLLSPAR